MRLGVSCAVGRGRVERYLEIGLDLSVVRGKDAMPGICLLAVNRLAALWSLDPRLPALGRV
jgi:hypothetical protein